MSYQSPQPPLSQFEFNSSTPPPPPPKPSTHSSGRGTPLAAGPPLPPPPPGQTPQRHQDYQQSSVTVSHDTIQPYEASVEPQAPQPEDGWLPELLKDKTTVDLQHILQTPSLQHALLHSPETAHLSLAASTAPLQALLAANISLANSLKALETHLLHQRQSTQSRLLSLRALERQWKTKQAEQDVVLREFSPPALYQRLSAAVGEQEALCRGLEESFLDGEGDAGDGSQASEREIAEFIRRVREGRKTAYLRRERKERWDEGRVGGWR